LAQSLRAADGIIRRANSASKRIYLFSTTFERWYPDARRRKQLTKYLRTRRVFGKGRRPDTCTREIFIAALGGKVACYVLSRKHLRRSIERALIGKDGSPDRGDRDRKAA
jgi:hypothetical protein